GVPDPLDDHRGRKGSVGGGGMHMQVDAWCGQRPYPSSGEVADCWERARRVWRSRSDRAAKASSGLLVASGEKRAMRRSTPSSAAKTTPNSSFTYWVRRPLSVTRQRRPASSMTRSAMRSVSFGEAYALPHYVRVLITAQ